MTPLHAASASGQISVVKNLLSNKVDVDSLNIEGNSPLHTACLNGQDVIVQELINAGSAINTQNNKGQTPLHYAAASTHGAMCLELLVNAKAETNIKVRPSQDRE